MTRSLKHLRLPLAELCGISRSAVIREGIPGVEGSMFKPDVSVEDAMKVLEALQRKHDFCCIEIRKPMAEGWEVALMRIRSDHKKPDILSPGKDSAAESICIAAAMVLGLRLEAPHV